MCKKLIVLVFCATVLFSGATMADVDDSGRLIVPEVSVAPIIDGELDDVWQKVGEESLLITEIINATSAVPEDLNDLSATFQVMHDADNFYVYVVIRDSVIDYQFSDWNGDGVEFFFDGDNSKGSSYDGVNDNQIRITVDDVELANIDSSLPVDGSAFKVILTDLGYNIEASFPLETLQIVPENTFGFEVQLNDNDGGSGRETLIRWFSNDNNSWRDASLFGEAILVSEPEPVNPGTDGLVALYALDGDVNDSSGNGLDGTIVGDPVFVEGVEGMAMDFDGVDDLVELGKFDVVGQITMAAWIKADDFEINDARVISKANEWGGNDHWWMLSTISETSLRFRLKTDDGQDTATLISDPVLEAGVWTHVAATWDGSMMRVYKDGQEVASQEKGGSAVAVDPAVSVAIGSQPSDAFASDPSRVVKFFDGLIDDARIYDRALSEGELLYLAGERATPVDPGTGGLVAFYALDGDANDNSGNELHSTIVGEPTFVEGKVGMALELDGVDDYVDIGNPTVLDFGTGDFTISAWINMTAIERGTVYAKGGDNSGGIRYTLAMGEGNDNKMTLTTDDDSDKRQAKGGTVVNDGIWHHVVGMRSGSTSLVYVDGDKDGSIDLPEGYDLSGTTQHNALLGAITSHPDSSLMKYFAGLLDEVAIYGRALTGGEIRYLAGYRAPVDPGNEGLVAHYAMENDASDSSGNGLHGAMVGDPTFVEGQVGYGLALEFDGVDDHVAIADDDAFDAMSEKFTITAWIKLSAEGMTDRRPILSKELEPDPDGRGWEFKVNNGHLAMQLYSPAEGEGKLTITGTTPLETDRWYHVVGIYQADGLEQFYINGQLDYEQELVTALQANDSPGNIGAYIWSPTGYQKYFAGLIDEVRAYSRVLSEPEVCYLAGDE